MKPLRFHSENLAKHGVRREEAKQAFRKGIRKHLHKVGRKVYQVIFQTTEGRYLEIVYRDFPD